MASREELREQKEKTSQALIQSALELCAEEGYASLSLRSVARKAGIAPTSFYRHFREIDELGVAM
nr:TetR family transcriptional regulator [Desulfobacterales bacterium]